MLMKKILFAVSVMGLMSGYASRVNATTVSQSTNTYFASIKYAKSELVTSAGITQVFSRIQEAAYRSCKEEYSHERFVKKRREMKKCVINVTHDLVNTIESKSLAKIAAQKPATLRRLASK